MSKSQLFFALFLLCTLSIYSQSYKTVIGKVTNLETNNPVEGAVCFLKNYNHVGAISSKNGVINLSIPTSMTTDTLYFSMLGYKDFYLPVESAINQKDSLYIVMEPNALMLQDILIETEGMDVSQIFLEALKKIPQNYPNKRHQLKAFYRNVSTEYHEYTYLEEAVITTDDMGYQHPAKLNKIKVEGLRHSKEFGEVDAETMAYLVKIQQSIRAKKWDVPINPLYSLYEQNYLRLSNKPKTHFDFLGVKKSIEAYSFQLMNVEVFESDTIYQIAFHSGPYSKSLSGKTYVKINISNYAITEFQFNSRLLGSVYVAFQPIGGRYYPRLIKTISPRLINMSMRDGEFDIVTLWIEEVLPSKFERIKPKLVVDRQNPKYNVFNKYHHQFWLENKIAANHPLDERIKQSLEKHESLLKQFQGM